MQTNINPETGRPKGSEAMGNNENLKNIPTCKLVEELKSREGVDTKYVDVNEPFSIVINGEKKNFESSFSFKLETGPAILMTIID